MRKLVALIVVALAATAGTAGGHSQEVKKQCADAVAPILCAIDFYRDGTWAYQAKTGTALTKTGLRGPPDGVAGVPRVDPRSLA